MRPSLARTNPGHRKGARRSPPPARRMDLDQDVSNDVKKAIAALPTSIKTRILY
jgi:hypothetical protein